MSATVKTRVLGELPVYTMCTLVALADCLASAIYDDPPAAFFDDPPASAFVDDTAAFALRSSTACCPVVRKDGGSFNSPAS